MASVVTGAHLSTLDLAASEYPVTTEVIHFYFHPAISGSNHIRYTALMHLLKSC
jgi:hypothetical protein